MESFYEFWINSIQFFLYKESKLEKDGLTDFENLFNSSYNFYEHYFEYISSNEVNFDLMFFWDFVGGVLYDNCDFTCTAIIFLIINTAVLSFIGAFDYLDIDEKTHKYSFFQIIYISLVYLFLWVGIGSSALLSQQIYIDSFEILNKKRQKDWEMEQEAKEKERREIELLKRLRKALKKNKIIKENSSIEEEYSYRIKMDDSQSIYQMQKNIIKSFTDDWDKKKKRLESFYIIYLTNFLAFLINYIVNREIIKYREKYISKELENTKKDDLHINIYLKDRNIFLLFICIPYILEIIISLIFYSIFYNSIFIEKKEKHKDYTISGHREKEKNKWKKNSEDLKIMKVSFKKLCGYIIFNQTLLIKPKIESKKEMRERRGRRRKRRKMKKIKKNKKTNQYNYFCECLALLLQSITKCLRNSFCFLYITFCPDKTGCCYNCYNCYCCHCCNCCYNDICCNCINCCNCCSCCYNICCCGGVCNYASFEQKDIGFCIFYQEKRKLKWFDQFINNKTQQELVQVVFLIAIFQSFTIGFEVLYDEKNENNDKQENIVISLSFSFFVYFIFLYFLPIFIYQ